MTNEQINIDSRVDAYVGPGCTLKGYMSFVRVNGILSQSQTLQFKNDIQDIDSRAIEFRRANYWQQVTEIYFSNFN